MISFFEILRKVAVPLAAYVPLTAASLASSPQPVADPRPILDKLHQNMASLKSDYLEFTQERHLKLFTDPLLSHGTMLIERPDQVRWETTEPFQSILLANHKAVAQFEYDDGQWKKLQMGFPQMLRRVMEQMSLMHQGKLDALTSDYNISVATNSLAILTLVPKDQTVRSMLSSLEIKMSPDLSATREVVMNEPNGDLTRIIFDHEKRDVKFPPGTFDQSKPTPLATIKGAVTDGK